MWVKIRVTEEQRTRWHATAQARGVSLSELVRGSLDGVRAVRVNGQVVRTKEEPARYRSGGVCIPRQAWTDVMLGDTGRVDVEVDMN